MPYPTQKEKAVSSLHSNSHLSHLLTMFYPTTSIVDIQFIVLTILSNTLSCPHIPHGFHMELIYSMWNTSNISSYSQVRFKNLISYKPFDQLIT